MRFSPPEALAPDIRACVDKFNTDRIAAYRSEETARIAQSILKKVQAEEAKGEDLWRGTSIYQNGMIFKKFPELEELLRGEIGDCIKAIYGSEYKIYHCSIIKKWRRRDEPAGSEIWPLAGSVKAAKTRTRRVPAWRHRKLVFS